MNPEKPRVAVVSFTDPRPVALIEEREAYIKEKHKELVKYLEDKGFRVIDPMGKIPRPKKEFFGLSTTKEVEACASILTSEGAEALVISASHLSALPGDYTREVEVACKLLDIPVIRLDDNSDMERFLETL